jgi:hypothetical protein
MEFFEKYKKIIFVAGFVLITLLMAFLIYKMFFANMLPGDETPIANTVEPVGGLPVGKEGGPNIASSSPKGGLPGETPKITEEPISSTATGGVTKTTELVPNTSAGVTAAKNGNGLQYYNKDDGKFYRIGPDGKPTPLSDTIFHDVDKITWSPNKNKAILEYPDGANIVYDFDSNKQVTLPKHWEDFNFSPNGDQIVLKSMGMDPDNQWLAVSNEDGTKLQPIDQIGANADKVYDKWSPNNQVIAMYTEGIDFDRQEVFFVGLNDENFKSTVIEGGGFQLQWSPAGDKLLYSVYSSANGMKPSLWLVNAEGEAIGSGRHSLGVETWAQKCTYSGDYDVYCAVPESLQEGAGIFPEMSKTTTDNLFKIDTRTGLKTLVAVPDSQYSMSNLVVSGDGKNLYFTDDATNRIHKVDLK